MRILLASLFFLSCDVVDLPIAEVPDGGMRRPMGPPCADKGECRPGDLCLRETCGSPLGRCAPRPALCPNDFRPTCGCDGVTYWNDCLRLAEGIEAIEELGSCASSPLTCATGAACPSGAFCAFLRAPQHCAGSAPGQCYVLPPNCQGGPPAHYFACSGAGQCLEACAAIRSEQPMRMEPGPCP